MRSAWFLALFALLYVAVVASHFSVAYIDFGDGNYLYISRRVADGAVLYRDILAPQPPCHLLVGSALIRLGRVFGPTVEHELYTVRAFSILLHLLTMLVVWRLALRLFRSESAAIWAAGLYLVIPVGFWWTLGYQSEPLEMFFLLGSFLLLLRWTRWPMAAAGLLGVLAISTNMTAVCYVGWIGLYLLISDWRRALWYVAPVIAGAGAVVGFGELLSGGHYLENVFFNQVGTFPHPDLYPGAPPPGTPLRGLLTVVQYAFKKVTGEGGEILVHEALFIAAAIAGLLLYLRRNGGSGLRNGGGKPPSAVSDPAVEPETEIRASNPETAPLSQRSKFQNPNWERGFVAWYGFWSLMAIGFVAKGATMDYIFTIGEPFVCVFAALAVSEMIRALLRSGNAAGIRSPLQLRILQTLLVVLGVVVFFARPAVWIHQVVRNQATYELDAKQVQHVRILIEQNSRPGDKILGAPYYAFISRRDLVEDLSELFIWQIKYGLEQRVEKTTGTATLKVNAIAKALRGRTVPVALINFRPGRMQLYAIEPIRDALGVPENYRPLLKQPIRTLNTDIHILVPHRQEASIK